jgi:putative oxidoreductase
VEFSLPDKLRRTRHRVVEVVGLKCSSLDIQSRAVSDAAMNELRLTGKGAGGFAFLKRPFAARWAPIPLRLIVGYGFMEHAFAKLSKGPEAFAGILHALGVPAPHLMAWLSILTELIGGLAVLLGAFLPLVSLPLAALLLVAVFTVHLPYGFSSIKLMSVTAGRAEFGPPGFECNLLYLACLTALVFAGSGPLGIDDYLRRKSERPVPRVTSEALE